MMLLQMLGEIGISAILIYALYRKKEAVDTNAGKLVSWELKKKTFIGGRASHLNFINSEMFRRLNNMPKGGHATEGRLLLGLNFKLVQPILGTNKLSA
jgi:hypothetical protein